MFASDESLAALREAVRVSPTNVPLRVALANALLGAGQVEPAIAEFRAGLDLDHRHVGLKFGLAQAYYRQGKLSHALVILEELSGLDEAPPKALVLYARLLSQDGETRKAVAWYKRALEADPALADPELSAHLGVSSPGADAGEGDDLVDGRLRAANVEPASPGRSELERPAIRFADVGGMEALKEEIRLKIVHPLKHPDLYKAYGKATGGGILMYGPPGCGKTHLARATAGEIQARFLAVGITDVLDMWIGNSEKNLHGLFEQARRHAPCVLFFDEVDALAASRTDMRTSAGRHLINQFLSELDGVQRTNDGVLVLGATNAPWHLDAAFRRPGRFDRILFVPPPDAPGRAAILRVLTAGKPVDTLDYERLAAKTEAFSGADLKALVDVAVEAKLRAAMQSGVPAPLTTADLAAAAASVKPSTREWFATARNYALYSNQGGAYDDILKYLKL